MRLPVFLFTAMCSLAPFFSYSQTTEEIATSEKQVYAARVAFTPSPLTNNYDVSYHRAEWTVDPGVRFIQGKITTYFTPVEPNVSTIYFDLDNTLVVEDVRYHKQAVTFEQTTEHLLKINLPASLPQNELDSLTITYSGVPPTTGHGSFEQTSHNGAPIIWTLSEPYGARDWWPCKQSLTDKIDSMDIIVRTPIGDPAFPNRVASNGLLVSELQEGSDMIYHWRHRYPIVTYLVALAVTNYVAFTNNVPVGEENIEVLNYVYPEAEAALRPQSENIVGMMQLFSELFGLYPFAKEKYGHAQFSWGGGMEHQTMSFMGSFNYDLMAHELAHQWFGDKVTCGSWHDIWVNEGFASYLTGLTKEHLSTPAAWKAWKSNIISSVTAVPGGSVWVPDTTNVNRIFSSRLSYNKGAYLLHMLRGIVGDEAFYSGIRNYLTDEALAYKFATGEDVRRHLEATSGKDLNEFFQDWYYGEGYPTYAVGVVQQGKEVTVTIKQNTSVPASVDFFEMPVPVMFKDASGNTSQTVVFDHTENEQTFTTELPFTIASVVVDPDLWILSPTKTYTLRVLPGDPTGLEDELQARIQLYPNPTKDRLFVQSFDGLRFEKVIVTNLLGETLLQTNAKNRTKLELATKQLVAGTYLLRIETSKGWVTKKFSIQ